MKQVKIFSLSFAAKIFFFLIILACPLLVSADEPSGIIPCTNDCKFNDLLTLVNTLIEKAIEWLILPIFILILMYSGVKYIISSGNPSVHAEVRKLLKNAIIGFLFILCSWLIVKVILTVLGYPAGLKFLQ